jgi:hypothetical protein
METPVQRIADAARERCNRPWATRTDNDFSAIDLIGTRVACHAAAI